MLFPFTDLRVSELIKNNLYLFCIFIFLSTGPVIPIVLFGCVILIGLFCLCCRHRYVSSTYFLSLNITPVQHASAKAGVVSEDHFPTSIILTSF